MIDSRRLRIFQAVAAHGSFSAAALELNYTPSAVSQQISTLEREVGLPLVTRSAQGTRLTEAGRILLTHSSIVIEQLQTAEAELRALTTLATGRLRIAAFMTAGDTILPAVLRAFRERFDDVEVVLVEADSLEAIQLIEDGDADLAVVFSYNGCFPDLRDQRVTCVDLFREDVHVALPADHPLAAERELSVGQLRGEQWVHAVSPSCGAFLRAVTDDAGFEPSVALQTDGYGAVLGSVAAGLGVALVPQLVLARTSPGVVARPLAERPFRAVACALPAAPSPAATAMLTLMETRAPAWSEAYAGPAGRSAMTAANALPVLRPT